MSYRTLLSLLAGAIAAGLAFAAPASAARFTCEAGALRGHVLAGPAIEPVTANRGAASCAPARAGGASALPAPLASSAAFAETSLTGGPDVARQIASSSGGVADLRILPLPDLGVQAPLDQLLVSAPGPITIPLVGTIDVRATLAGLLTLPQSELLRVQAGVAYALARCTDGAVDLQGSARVSGISVLGRELPVDQPVTRTIDVVGGGSIDLSRLDPTQIKLIGGVTLDPAVYDTAVRPVLAAIPPVAIPAQVASVRITPGTQTRTGTQLTQTAVRVEITALGRQLVDLTIGEASAGADDVGCAPVSVTQAALQCTTRRLVLTDVLERGGRVRLTGAADRRYVGKRVSIVFTADGRRVARPKVRRDGSFKATAPLPARRLRGTNRARYQARIGRERSLALKLRRRMVVRSVRVSGGKVRIRGAVTRPLAKPVRRIEVRRRVSCSRSVVVARIRPDRRGRFFVTVDAPPRQQAAVYRFATRVRKNTRNPKTYPTFTLPRYVDLS